MARQPLVLLVPKDRLTDILTSNGLVGYGYDVLVAASVGEAFDLLRTNPRISVLVVNVEIENASEGLALAKAARRDDPKIKVVYTCSIPNRLPEREKVTGAPLPSDAISSASACRCHRADIEPVRSQRAGDARRLTCLSESNVLLRS
jgi:CheY-like chemotaxis protein